MPPSDAFDVCLLTPPGRGAVATLAVAGCASVAAVGRFFRPSAALPIESFVAGRIYYGRWGSERGEEIVVCRRSENELEIHCHGGKSAGQAIVDDLASAGGRLVDWREWLARRTSDPIEQAAQVALAAARTERTADILLAQYHGALRRELRDILDDVQRDALPAAAERLRVLRSRSACGLHLTAAYQVVLAGRPNVGKSSLTNALVGYQRAIVFDQPGTTRDVVTAETAIDGWPVVLSDTAGLRASSDLIEDAGVRRARERLLSCDLVVLIFDATCELGAEEERICDEFPHALLVVNKCDLARAGNAPLGRAIVTSARTVEGIGDLLAEIGRRLVPDPPPADAAVPFTTTHAQAIEDAFAAVERNDAMLAQQALAALLS